MSSEKPDKTKLTLWLPPEFIKRAKIAAVEQGRSVSDLIREAVDRMLSEPPPDEGKKQGLCHG